MGLDGAGVGEGGIVSARYDRIEMHWTADFLGIGKSTIELTPDDQADPRLLALVDWWKEKLRVQSVAATNPGDPFTAT